MFDTPRHESDLDPDDRVKPELIIEPLPVFPRIQARLTRQNHLKVIGVVLVIIILSACTNTFTVPASPTSTSLPTLTETLQPTVTPSQTPRPTATPVPTETPGPMWLTRFGEFPHAINDYGQDTYNFELEFTDWLRLPDITPRTIDAYHDALKQIKLSDGTPLVKPMNGPEFTNLPQMNWQIVKESFETDLNIGNQNVGDMVNPPVRYVGGFIYTFPGTKQNWFTGDYVGITMQVVDRSKPDGYSLWTAIFPTSAFNLTPLNDHTPYTKMSSGYSKPFMNNGSQFIPLLEYKKGNPDKRYWDLQQFLRSEGWYDPTKNNQAFQDFIAGKANSYLDSHFILARIAGTRWISP
jgi:hypothetical protein